MGAWCLRSGTGLRPLPPAPFADGPIEMLRRSKRGNISIVHRFEGLHEGTGAQRLGQDVDEQKQAWLNCTKKQPVKWRLFE